jgi:hypothetical protein
MPGVPQKSEHSVRKSVEPPLARRIAALAEGQSGNVALYQLEALGMKPRAAQQRAARGHWRRMHTGVYFIGHGPITQRSRWHAAVLACGPKACLSHRSAAALHGLRADNRVKTDVSLPSKSVHQKRGIHAHAAASLTGEDITEIDGIPCTTLERTLIDLAEVVDRRSVVLAIDQTEHLQVFDRWKLEKALRRAKGRRGAAIVRSILDEYHGPTNRAPFVAAFLELCDDIGLHHPAPEALIDLEDGPIHVDFLWREERIVIELDSRAFHDSTKGFDTDRDRDQRLLLAGYIPVRLTWRQLTAQAERSGRRLRELHQGRR